MIHPKANPTKDGTATCPTPHVAQTGDPLETVRRRVGRSPRSSQGLGREDGGERDGRRRGWGWKMEAHGWRGDGGERDGGRMKMEGSETGGAWVGREEGREWEAHMGVDGAGEGRWRGDGVAWVWTGLGGAWVWTLARLIC